jgi:benzoyl-CoA reductase/2-hydroxyglutaryl-CoA dehydratase subunit BcrC/BadD/HgdB
VARGSRAGTPAADAHLEPDLFPSRIRQLVDAALTGRLVHVAQVVIPRTSDPDYKGFLYLREFARTGRIDAMARTEPFDLLYSGDAHVRRYTIARTGALLDLLSEASGHRVSGDELREEIDVTNAARAAARRLAAFRRGVPRVSGTEAFPVLGAFWHVPPREYASLANQAAEDLATRPPLPGPRVLFAGAPVDGTALHAAVEARGALVVDELTAWTSAASGDDVRCADDPIAALADAYRRESIGPRLPAAAMQARFECALDHVDAVVVSLPEDDATFGWDYPALRDRLTARDLPHVVLRADPHRVLTPADGARVDALIEAADRRHRAHHG